MSLLADLEEFIQYHRRYGVPTGQASPSAWNGYLLTVACPSGVVFRRWVTSLDAEMDVISWARSN